MDARIVAAGDSAWLIELPERLDPVVNARAIEIATRVQAAQLPAVTDIVVGYRTVMVYVRPLLETIAPVVPTLAHILTEGRPAEPSPAGATLTLPVCYDADFALDLPDVAAFGGLPPDEVVRRHVDRDYRVFMVGFVPGFAYMAEVDPAIAAPRRQSPRLRVPPGSVGIASGQTGIYPDATPGGWNIVGRCPRRPYDPSRPDPFLMRAGDCVRFRSIDIEEYRATTEWGDA
jgi:inhibitor of KinA